MGILKRSAVLCVAALFCWLVAPSTVDAKKKANAGGNQVRRATDHAAETATLIAAGPSVTLTGLVHINIATMPHGLDLALLRIRLSLRFIHTNDNYLCTCGKTMPS